MSLKAEIRSGKVTVGSWITLAHPAIAEIMAKAGFDLPGVKLFFRCLFGQDRNHLRRYHYFRLLYPLQREVAQMFAELYRTYGHP